MPALSTDFEPLGLSSSSESRCARQIARRSCAMRPAEPMRCFYCAATGKPASEEHVPSQFLGSRLKTRRVCRDCNTRAAREIDDRFADYLMVKMPKALADVRSIKHQGKEPSFEIDATISATGERVRVRFTPRGREVRRASGETVHDVIEVRYGLDSDLWVQFNAKVALGCAAKLFPDEWLDEPLARALRNLLWHGPIDNTIWPAGPPGWPGELEPAHPARQALGEDRHMVGFLAGDQEPREISAVALLFGGQIAYSLPLPGLAMPHSGRVWILDWQDAAPPRPEDYDCAIERMLCGRGWSASQIRDLRSR